MRPSNPFGLLIAAAWFGLSAVACAAPSSEESPDPDEETASTSDELQVAADSARCEGEGISFTLTRTRSNWPSRTRPVSYKLSAIIRDGVALPGSFSEDSSPVGVNFRAEWWNGMPLNGSRFATDSRMHAEKPRGPDNRGSGFGGIPLAWGARVRCVANLGAAPSFVDRFRLAYELHATNVIPGRRDPQLRAIANAPASSLPANFASKATDPRFAVFEFEGKRIYSYARSYTVFYDALGAPFAKGTWGKQQLPTESQLSPDEWTALPPATWRWGLDD